MFQSVRPKEESCFVTYAKDTDILQENAQIRTPSPKYTLRKDGITTLETSGRRIKAANGTGSTRNIKENKKIINY